MSARPSMLKSCTSAPDAVEPRSPRTLNETGHCPAAPAHVAPTTSAAAIFPMHFRMLLMTII